MEETNAGCRIFVRKNLGTQPFGRRRIILDDNKIRGFLRKQTANIITRIWISPNNVSIDC
jgi:hypothetical protein